MAIWKVIPAIAAGCTIVLKPSKLAPLTCLLFGELTNEAGLPPGVLNIVSGRGSSAGAALASHDGVDKISFTGSGPTAQRIMSAAAMGPRGICLELGGKSPLLVFDDISDVNAAVDWIMTGFLWGSGQVCSATSRLLLQNGIREQILDRLKERLSLVRIGPSLDREQMEYEGPTMGPVVSREQYERVLEYIVEGKKEGLNFFWGGEEAQAKLQEKCAKGYFIHPTIILDVSTESRLWREEIFGPVLCIRSFEHEEEAIALANETMYGLAAAVFSSDEERLERVARSLRAGVVWKNCCEQIFVQCPWGGFKKSGFGRELGRWGLEEFIGVKQITSCPSDFSLKMW